MNWSDWIDEAAHSVGDFYTSFKKWPNVLVANEHTISQFEFITEVSPIGQELMDVDTELTGSQTNNVYIRELTFKGACTLVFHVNDDFPDKLFRLKHERQKRKNTKAVKLDTESPEKLSVVSV